MEDSDTTIIFFAIILAGLLPVQYVILLLRAKLFWVNFSSATPKVLPKVSVLISSRNEEKTLPSLLASLEKLQYPQEKIEFLLADDESIDQTNVILEKWCAEEDNRQLFVLDAQTVRKAHLNGKANALAWMGEKAQGEYLFFTDSDCQVNPNWILEGIQSMSKNTGVLNGVTEVAPHSLLGEFQKLDWWNTLGIIKIVSDWGGHTTGLGNNMVISREAYLNSGGFSSIPPTLTEDLEIARLIKDSGYEVHQQVSPNMLVFTKEEKSWKGLLSQRARWMKGVLTLPWGWKLALGTHLLFFIAIAYLFVQNIAFGLSIWVVKILLQSFFLIQVSKRAGRRLFWAWLLLYDFYYLLASTLTILYYFWPSKITWKSRQYP